MTQSTDLAWYVYAITEAGAPEPQLAGLLADTTVDAISFGPLGVLATLVPRALFDDAHEDNRTVDPAWMAECAVAHHAVAAAVAAQQACLPLGFGTLFSSLDRLAAWLQHRESGLLAGLAQVAGQSEWSLAIQEDPARHGAWLDRNDEELRRLARLAENAGVGTAFLMAKRIEKARNLARVRHLDTLETRIGNMLMLAGGTVLVEHRKDGSPAWSVLAAPEAGGAKPFLGGLPALAGDIAPRGLGVSLTGPWPSYAFTKAILMAEVEHV